MPAATPPSGGLTALRLLRPFASLLGGLVVSIVALVAGAAPGRALALGASMTLLGFAAGTMHGIAGLRRDGAGRGGRASGAQAPGASPVRAGKRGAGAAVPIAPAVLGVCAAGGLLLALSAGVAVLVLASLVLVIGLWSARSAAGTRLSWLPAALTVPLLPAFGWLGATGGLPPSFALLVPAAALGGAALAISSAVVDAERDAASGAASIATALGATGAAAVSLALQLAVAAAALLSLRLMGASGDWPVLAGAAALGPVLGAALGVLVARRGRGAREAAFELQAVGLAVLAVAWVNTLGGVGPA